MARQKVDDWLNLVYGLDNSSFKEKIKLIFLKGFLLDKVRFDRNELAGAFGDLGTFIPLITALAIINNFNLKTIFLEFSILYIYSGLTFGIPIPIQPMKAIAAIMIAEKPPLIQLFGAEILIGAFFIILSLTNAIELLNKVVPESVVRGIQIGLGFKLMLLAFNYFGKGFLIDFITSIAGILIALLLWNNRKIPSALLILALGINLPFLTGKASFNSFFKIGLMLPKPVIPSSIDLMNGSLLASSQIPLTIGNAIMATSLLAKDLFPERRTPSIRKLSLTTGIMNLLAVFLGGIPVCHGSGGLAAHYRFGARTGGAMIIIGVILLALSILHEQVLYQLLHSIPFSILGVFLFFAGLQLTMAVKKVLNKNELLIALLIAILSISFRYGYLIGLMVGITLSYAIKKWKCF